LNTKIFQKSTIIDFYKKKRLEWHLIHQVLSFLGPVMDVCV
jgi:hypothetical protein